MLNILVILYLGFDKSKLLCVTLYITFNYETNFIFLQDTSQSPIEWINPLDAIGI